jgi:pyruvate dehydrogenase complex dehydrogenase (E1) component
MSNTIPPNIATHDSDPQETSEWIQALEAIVVRANRAYGE